MRTVNCILALRYSSCTADAPIPFSPSPSPLCLLSVSTPILSRLCLLCTGPRLPWLPLSTASLSPTMSSAGGGCDWSRLSPDVLFLHALSWVDSATFFHQLPRVSHRWAAAQSDDRWYDSGSQWLLSIADRLRLSDSQRRAWQDNCLLDLERLQHRTRTWRFSNTHPALVQRQARRRANDPLAEGPRPTAADLRLSASLLWWAGRSLQWQLMEQQGVGVRHREADGVCEYYEVPVALHQYFVDWLTVRQLPICFTAGEAREEAEDRGRYVPQGLIWDGDQWWTDADLDQYELTSAFWHEHDRHTRNAHRQGDEEGDDDDDDDEEEEEEEEERGNESVEKEEEEGKAKTADGGVSDSDEVESMSISSGSEGEVLQEAALQVESGDWSDQAPWLWSNCPLLQLTSLMQCTCFHASAYSGDDEYSVTAVWLGPLPEMDSFDRLYADVDFTGDESDVAERCLQAEAALSRSLRLHHGDTSRCGDCATSPIVGAMFTSTRPEESTLCDACYHQQPRTVAWSQQAGYRVSLEAWLADTAAHPTYQPATLDDSPTISFFHDRPPQLDALNLREVFLDRQPSGEAAVTGMSKAARAALQAWLREPVAVNSEQSDYSRCRLYTERPCVDEGVEADEKAVDPLPQANATWQRRRLALGRLLPLYWEAVLDEAYTAAEEVWREMRDREANDGEWSPTPAQEERRRAEEQSEGDSNDDADVQLQDGRDPLWDEAHALSEDESERLTRALAVLPEADRHPSALLEAQLAMLAGQWLKRSRAAAHIEQPPDEAPSSKRLASDH